MYKFNRSTGLIMMLSFLMLMLTSCRDYQAEEQIKANAQVQIANSQAQAQRDISFNQANAAVGVAQAQKEATISVSNNQAEAAKYASSQATVQTGMWVSMLPTILIIIAGAGALWMVIWYRGQSHLLKVKVDVQRLLPPSAAPSLLLTSNLQPPTTAIVPSWTPEAVRVMVVEQNADRVSENAAGEWRLYRHGELLLTMRPKQLTDGRS